jgi:hypothetical protein
MKISGHLAAGCVAAVTGLVATATPAQQAAVPKKAVRPTLPPTAGPGSISGVWNSPNFSDSREGPPVGAEQKVQTADGQPVPFQPAVVKLLEQRRREARNGQPVATNGSFCLSGGMPSMMHVPAQLSLQILETPGQVTVLFEFYGTFRIVRLNEAHLPDADPSYFGDSVGHWEGNTLVVDTIGLSEKTLLFGAPHGDKLHLLERIRRTGADTLEDRITIDDPKTFTKPFTWVVDMKRFPGMRIGEYVCDNQRNGVGVNGETDVQLQSSSR